MGQPQIPTSEQLMAEMAWIRRLARALVKDDATADDVAQDAWLVATEQRPAEDRPLRPWLARVIGNLVRNRRRGDARRGERDAAFDASRDIPTPAELIERVELQRTVADEVLALAEPYRSTVLLHFVEGYSSVEIARQLGIPDGTVRRRLKTALEQLREALEKRTDQQKRVWLAALVPLARSPGPTPVPAAMGVVAMKKVLGLVILIVLLAALGVGAVWRHRMRGRDAAASSGSTTGTSSQRSLASGTGAPAGSTSHPWFPQTTAPPHRIAGRVMSHGKPIGGAKVRLGLEVIGEPNPYLVMPDSLTNVLEPIAKVTSAPDGTFDFGVQPAAAFTVSASAASYSPAAVRVNGIDSRSPPDHLVLELGDCSSRLSGKIADASGGGIAGAQISVDGLSGTDSDATGTYSVCLTPRDALGTPAAVVRIAADGYGTVSQAVIVVGDLHHDFLLVPEAVLVGRVTTGDAQPVAGAFVTARSDPASGPSPGRLSDGWAVTDSDGRFRIAGLAPGAFHLEASAQDLHSPSLVPAVAQPATTSRELHLVIAKPTNVARVRGHVFLNGAPISGVSVVVGGRSGPPAVSQADGSFVLDRVPYGATQFHAAPYRVESPGAVQIAKPEVDGVRLDLAKMGSLRGHVTRGGQPVVGADVLYTPPPQSEFFGPAPATKTDAHGAFVIEGIPAGPGQMMAWDNGAKAFSESRSLNIADGEDKTVDLQLDCSGEVKGTVVDEAGNPVPGVYMRMDLTSGGDMCESMTDAQGRFDCAMLYGGEYLPTVAPTPGARQGFAPAIGDQLVLVHVPRAGVVTGIQLAIKNERLAIRGVVVDDTGATVPDVRIDVIGHGESSMDFPFAMSDTSGHFAITDLARGTYNLHAEAADGSESDVPDIAAGSNAVSIKLARAGAIEGTLVGFATIPRVFVQGENSGQLTLLGANVVGTTFSRTGLPPGQYTVEADGGRDVDGQAVEVHPGETAHLTLQSRGTGTVDGTVSELAAHTPVAGMRCDAYLTMGGQVSRAPPDVTYQAFTDATGHFTVNAPLGHVRIFCFSPTVGPLSPAATDVDVTDTDRPTANVFSVRATFGSAPSNPGFATVPLYLPVTVGQVVPDGPAAAAGLRVGDHLVTIDGTSLHGLAPVGVMALLMNHRPGTTATLRIERGGALQTIKMVVK